MILKARNAIILKKLGTKMRLLRPCWLRYLQMCKTDLKQETIKTFTSKSIPLLSLILWFSNRIWLKKLILPQLTKRKLMTPITHTMRTTSSSTMILLRIQAAMTRSRSSSKSTPCELPEKVSVRRRKKKTIWAVLRLKTALKWRLGRTVGHPSP